MPMNKLYSILFFISGLLIAPALSAQQVAPITPENPQYDALKAAGQLPQQQVVVGYIPTPSGGVFSGMPEPTLVEKASTMCDPIIPIDNTWLVAPFTNGSAPLYRNDDGSTPVINLPFTFTFYGNNYTSFYINNNGNISFGGAYSTFSSSGFPFNTYVMLAPFWADVDTRNTSSGVVRYKITPTAVIIRWENVGYYSMMADKVNDFQLILTDGNDPIIPVGTNVQFAYNDMQWTTGSASGGTNGFGGTPATVGANLGDNVNYIQFGRYDHAGVDSDGAFGAADGVSWLDYRAFYFDVATNNNVAPVPTGIAACDTVSMCVGDTMTFNFSFLAPEPNQIVTATINSGGIPNFTGSSTPGNNATGTAQFIPTVANVGYNTLDFQGTDNGTPVATTNVSLVVLVYPTVNPPVITGDSVLCPGEVTTLTTALSPDYTYTWDPPLNNSNTAQINAPGTYKVTIDSLGCQATSAPINVISVPNPVPVIGAPVSSCVTGQSTFGATPGFDSYSWSPGNYTTDTVTVSGQGGTYTVTVTDTNGCTGTAQVIVPPISNISATVDRTADATCPGTCDGLAEIDVIDFTGTVSYTWTPAQPDAALQQTLCAGNYSVVVTDDSGCKDTVTFDIGEMPRPVAAFSSNAAVVNALNPYVVFTDGSTSDVTTWAWVFADEGTSSDQHPGFLFSGMGEYDILLTVANQYGCQDTATQHISIQDINTLYIPQAFTPNKDGLNEIFRPVGVIDADANYQFFVFDRWGQTVFYTEDFTEGWNGTMKDKEALVDTYVYKVVLSVKDTDTEKTYTGRVSLIR